MQASFSYMSCHRPYHDFSRTPRQSAGLWSNVRRSKMFTVRRALLSNASIMEQHATMQDAPHQPQQQEEQQKQPCLQATGYEARVIGAMIGALCGDVLGHPWEAQSLNGLKQQQPGGITDFAAAPELRCYTGDSQLAIALARSLVAHGRLDAAAASATYAAAYDIGRGYRHADTNAYQALVEGADYTTLGRRFMLGGFGHGGAARAAPLGLAYRHALPEVLRSAVEGALLCSHAHPIGVDGAWIQAAAVAWLSQRRPAPWRAAAAAAAAPAADAGAAAGVSVAAGRDDAAAADGMAQSAGAPSPVSNAVGDQSADARDSGNSSRAASGSDASTSSSDTSAIDMAAVTPLALLDYLIPLANTDDMSKRLRLMRMWTTKVKRPAGAPAHVASWREHLRSEAFATSAKVANMIADQMQTKATDAVAVALWALICHWENPENAVVCAVHFGGYCHTIGALTGALAGSLHGCKWVPDRWFLNLEDSPEEGRDMVVELARQLAALDCRD